MNALIRAAPDLQSVCETHEWRFCFIGGLAVLRWGEPRETIDVGLMLITGFGHESEFVSVLTQAFEPRIDDAAAAHQDLIVLKAFADRPKDWMDIEGVIIRHAPVFGLAVRARTAGAARGIEGRSGPARATRADARPRQQLMSGSLLRLDDRRDFRGPHRQAAEAAHASRTASGPGVST